MELSVKMRTALVISVLWILGWLAYAVAIWRRCNSMVIFLGFGIIPIIAFWGIAWIIQGLKKTKQIRKPTLSKRTFSTDSLDRGESSINYKFINEQGKEVSISGLDSFIELVKSGQIERDTLLYDDKKSNWRKASEYEEFQAVFLNLEKSKEEDISVFPASEHKTQKKSKKLVILSILLILGAIVLLSIATVKYSPNGAEGIAYTFGMMMGYFFWLAIISYLIERFIFKKREWVGLLCFSILFFGISSYKANTMITEYHQAKNVANDMSLLMKEYARDMFSEQNQEIPPPNHSPHSYGKLEPIVAWFKNQQSVAKQASIDFDNALERESIENILTLDTLSNESKIIDARRKLTKINRIIDDYENRVKKWKFDALNQLNNLRVNENIKNNAVDGFLKGHKEVDEYLKEFFRIERACFAEMDSLLNFLLSRKGKYSVENGQIVFISGSDATYYNNNIEKITLLGEEESKLMAKYQKGYMSKIQKIEKSVP